MKKIAFLFAFISSIAFTANAKVKFLYIKELLRNAKTIKSIIVIGYNETTMLYKFENGNDTFKISCKVKEQSEGFRIALIKGGGMLETDLAGSWPKVGQQVLIVISKVNHALLFANKEGGYYRFWDPNSIAFANSIFVFPKEKSFKPLKLCIDNLSIKKESESFSSCSDGCLVNKSYIKERS